MASTESSWPSAVQQRLHRFAEQRDWQRFHTPRNLLLALVGEVGELAELYQWAGDDLVGAPDAGRVADEIADTAIYLLRFADVAGVDLEAAVAQKLERNEERFPTEKWFGRAGRDR